MLAYFIILMVTSLAYASSLFKGLARLSSLARKVGGLTLALAMHPLIWHSLSSWESLFTAMAFPFVLLLLAYLVTPQTYAYIAFNNSLGEWVGKAYGRAARCWVGGCCLLINLSCLLWQLERAHQVAYCLTPWFHRELMLLWCVLLCLGIGLEQPLLGELLQVVLVIGLGLLAGFALHHFFTPPGVGLYRLGQAILPLPKEDRAWWCYYAMRCAAMLLCTACAFPPPAINTLFSCSDERQIEQAFRAVSGFFAMVMWLLLPLFLLGKASTVKLSLYLPGSWVALLSCLRLPTYLQQALWGGSWLLLLCLGRLFGRGALHHLRDDCLAMVGPRAGWALGRPRVYHALLLGGVWLLGRLCAWLMSTEACYRLLLPIWPLYLLPCFWANLGWKRQRLVFWTSVGSLLLWILICFLIGKLGGRKEAIFFAWGGSANYAMAFVMLPTGWAIWLFSDRSSPSSYTKAPVFWERMTVRGLRQQVLIYGQSFLRGARTRAEKRGISPRWTLFVLALYYFFPYLGEGVPPWQAYAWMRFLRGGNQLLLWGLFLLCLDTSRKSPVLAFWYYITLFFVLPFEHMLCFALAPEQTLPYLTLALLVGALWVDQFLFLGMLLMSLLLVGAGSWLWWGDQLQIPSYQTWWALFQAGSVHALLFFFLHKRERFFYNRLQEARLTGGSIAHETRNFLHGVISHGELLGTLLAQEASRAKLSRQTAQEGYPITPAVESFLQRLAHNLQEEGKKSKAKVALLQEMLQQEVMHVPLRKTSLKRCIEETLQDPYFDGPLRARVSLELSDDFTATMPPLLFKHVLYNIIKNAYWHGGASQITLTLEAAKRQLHLHDNGRGIPLRDRPYIFDLFYSAGAAGSVSHGIGLALTQKILASFGATIGCTSACAQVQQPSYTLFTITFY